MNTVKILIDTKGGDHGAPVLIKGAAAALEKFEELCCILVGDEDLIKEECVKNGMPMARVEIMDARGEITNFDNPAEAIFQKTDSSMLAALQALAVRSDADRGKYGCAFNGRYPTCWRKRARAPCFGCCFTFRRREFYLSC